MSKAKLIMEGLKVLFLAGGLYFIDDINISVGVFFLIWANNIDRLMTKAEKEKKDETK